MQVVNPQHQEPSYYARIIERYFDPSNGRDDDRQSASEAATEVVGQVERMDAVVKGFREPIKRGKAKIEPVPVKGVTREALDLVKPLLQREGIDVVVAVDRPIRRIMADKLQLEHERSRGHGQQAIDTARTEPERRDLCFGKRAGFPAGFDAQRRTLFVSSKPDGLGVGLSVSRTTIESHSGQMYRGGAPDGAVVPLRLRSEPRR